MRFSQVPAVRFEIFGADRNDTCGGRVREMTQSLPMLAEVAPQGIDHELRRLHFETGNAANSPSMAALLDYVLLSQVLFGTDAPFFGLDMNLRTLRGNRLSTEQLTAIEHGNALRLLPGLGLDAARRGGAP